MTTTNNYYIYKIYNLYFVYPIVSTASFLRLIYIYLRLFYFVKDGDCAQKD